MSRRLQRLWLTPLLFLAGHAFALGLGDVRLNSALNQPLRAEIELLAATPDELDNLVVQLASAETFSRYDLDRPLYLTRVQFEVVRSGRADGNFVRVTSLDPVTEPFITFLVEAVWSRGRLLREYTLLLDPPTFAPPPTTPAEQAVTAPSRAVPADSGQIQRAAPQEQAPQPRPAPQPVQPPVQSATEAPTQATPVTPTPQSDSRPEYIPPVREEGLDPRDFSSTPGGDMQVVRGDTLWGITSRVRPDSRLTFNQTMLAIYEANPDAFEGNINRLKAGVTLRIPSASQIFNISRGDAFSEVRRQNAEWRGEPLVADAPADAVPEPAAEPNLTLVPPDEEDLALTDTSVGTSEDEPLADDAVDDVVVDPTDARIREIEALLEDDDALIEIPDNELAALRAELAALRGEELPVEDLTGEPIEDESLVDEAEAVADTDTAEEPVVEEPVTAAPAVVSRPAPQASMVDTILGYLTNFWVIIGAALVVAVGVLVWFMRRATGDDDDSSGMWQTLDESGDADTDPLASTESLSAIERHDETTILVEESAQPERDDAAVENLMATGTMELPPADVAPEPPASEQFDEAPEPVVADPEPDTLDATGINESLEDTFSSETAINLDQSDPIAEADFHMAYGLYDQAADLINGALSADPNRQDLLAKLSEIYFVWGNRDAFIDSAARLQSLVGDTADPEWDKIVIMGQQIAGDHEMFSGVSAGAATKAVDLSFEDSDGDTGALDMNLEDEPADDMEDEVIDLGSETGQVPIAPSSDTSIDFSFEEEPDPLAASATREMEAADDADNADDAASGEAVDTPAAATGTFESPTIEQQFDVLEATGELPTVQTATPEPATDATAEIDLDDLGLDLDSIADPSMAEDISEDTDDTAESQILDIDDPDATGERAVTDDFADPDATGTNSIVEAADTSEQTGIMEGIDIAESMLGGDDDPTLMATDEDAETDADVDVDTSLLDATGMTQVISEDMAVETGTDIAATLSDDDKTMLAPGLANDAAPADLPSAELPDDAETMLASLDDDEPDGDFDFARTEALPKDTFSPDMSSDETGNMPGLTGSTDMDLDLDDLTAALKVSEVGDTINQVRDDKTVEQPRINPADIDLDVGTAADEEGGTTQALAPDDLTGDLHDARTMTEVGTKLDLARAYVDMGDPGGARSILEEVLDEGDEGQRQQAQQLLDSLPA